MASFHIIPAVLGYFAISSIQWEGELAGLVDILPLNSTWYSIPIYDIKKNLGLLVIKVECINTISAVLTTAMPSNT